MLLLPLVPVPLNTVSSLVKKSQPMPLVFEYSFILYNYIHIARTLEIVFIRILYFILFTLMQGVAGPPGAQGSVGVKGNRVS